MGKSICLMDAWKASYLAGDEIKLRNVKRASFRAYLHAHIYLIIVILNYASSFDIQNSSFWLTLSDPKSMWAVHIIHHIMMMMIIIIFMTNMQINSVSEYNLCNLPLVPLPLMLLPQLPHTHCSCCCIPSFQSIFSILINNFKCEWSTNSYQTFLNHHF